jgi:Stealth protein CR2, conserved region 2/Stealth protein CR1, conserved region 1/Stealth protein CR3, conserved region 3
MIGCGVNQDERSGGSMSELMAGLKMLARRVLRRPGLLPLGSEYRRRPGFSVVRVNGLEVVARDVVAAQPWHQSAQLARRCQQLFADAGIECWAIHPLGSRVFEWSVRRSDFARAVQTVSREFTGEAIYLKAKPSIGVPTLVDDLDPAALGSASFIDVFQYVHDQWGRVFPDYVACRVVPWDPSDRGTLVCRDREAVIQEIEDLSPIPVVEVPSWDGASLPRPAILAEPDPSEVAFPIDAVYMWVDDSDPAWRARRDAVVEGTVEPESDSDSEAQAPARYRDRGELRASFRSLELYAPWIRTIYLVTDRQRPSWLDPDSSRVVIVDHRDIFEDPSVLPSFNSHAIESQLHRIPGLSEYYLYLNDDVLFNVPVSPTDFFTPQGKLKVVLSRSHRPLIDHSKLTPLEQARANSARLLERDFGRPVTKLFAHVPFAQSKALAAEVSATYAEEIAATVSHPFRCGEDYVITSWLFLYTALFTGRAVPSTLTFAYFNVAQEESRRRMAAWDRFAAAAVLCVNDSPDQTSEGHSATLEAWLRQLYAVPTAYELRGSTPEA